MNVEVIQRLMDTSPDFQLKFVVCEPADLTEIRDVLQRLRGWSPSDVHLMPEGTDGATLNGRSAWLSDICKREGFRLCARLHVLLYGNRRGT